MIPYKTWIIRLHHAGKWETHGHHIRSQRKQRKNVSPAICTCLWSSVSTLIPAGLSGVSECRKCFFSVCEVLLTAGSQKSSWSLRSFSSDLWRIKLTADPNTAINKWVFVSVCTVMKAQACVFEVLPSLCNIMTEIIFIASSRQSLRGNRLINIINNENLEESLEQTSSAKIELNVKSPSGQDIRVYH